jgi:hypothetical protein
MKLEQYNQHRHLVLATADRATGLMQRECGGTDMGCMDQVLALDEAWRKLKESLQSG